MPCCQAGAPQTPGLERRARRFMRLPSKAALASPRIRSLRLRITEGADEKLDGDMGLGLLDRETRSSDPGFVKPV